MNDPVKQWHPFRVLCDLADTFEGTVELHVVHSYLPGQLTISGRELAEALGLQVGKEYRVTIEEWKDVP